MKNNLGVQEGRMLVRVLVDRGCQPDLDIDTMQVVTWIIEDGLSEDDCLLGLAYAGLRGWVVARKFRTIALTLAGLSVAKGLN
jgi:hypothetical protein